LAVAGLWSHHGIGDAMIYDGSSVSAHEVLCVRALFNCATGRKVFGMHYVDDGAAVHGYCELNHLVVQEDLRLFFLLQEYVQV
jgi:hypothetical protein